MTTFHHTRAALIVYDAAQPEISRMFANASSDLEISQAYHVSDEALLTLQKAFHKDTQTYNSLTQCQLADYAFIKRMAEL